MKKYLLPLLLLLAALSLPACGAGAAPVSWANSFEESHQGLLSLMGTRLAYGVKAPVKEDFSYDELLNQTVCKLGLANGGVLEINGEQKIVQVDNFQARGPKSRFTLEEVMAALGSEWDLEGYTLTKNQEFSGDYHRLVWEKQLGDYRNPHDSLYVLLDKETMLLVDLKWFRFVAEESEPVLSQEEALAKAEPHLEGRQDNEARLTYVRPEEGTLKWGTVPRLAYVFTNNTVKVSVDAQTGEVIGLAYAAAAEKEG